jgi:hypothetical protein
MAAARDLRGGSTACRARCQPGPAAVAHVAAHELGAAAYAIKAARAAAPEGEGERTGRRYPLFDKQGLPCAFTSTEKAAFVLGAPRIAAGPLCERWRAMRADRRAERTMARSDLSERDERMNAIEQACADHAPGQPSGPPVGKVGTRSAALRWVDEHVSPLELLAELTPESELRRAGRGYIGWCPFHDDRVPDAATGAAGSASFYVDEDRRDGWSWRCLSTTCAQSVGPMRHSFRLLQELLGVSVATALREAAARLLVVGGAVAEEGKVSDGSPWLKPGASTDLHRCCAAPQQIARFHSTRERWNALLPLTEWHHVHCAFLFLPTETTYRGTPRNKMGEVARC